MEIRRTLLVIQISDDYKINYKMFLLEKHYQALENIEFIQNTFLLNLY